MACQLLKAARFVGLDAKQAQLELGRGPGEIHRSIDRVGIAVLVHQPQDTLPRFARCENQRYLDTLARTQCHALAQAEDGVQDETLAVAQLLRDTHRVRERSSTSDESTPVGLEPQGLVLSVFKRKTVCNIDGWVVVAATTAVREQCLLFRNGLRLDEKLVKRRMLSVCVVWRH